MKGGWRRVVLAWWLPVAAAWAAYEPVKLPDASKRWAVSVNLRGEYDDNIFTTASNEVSSLKSIVEPQILVNFPGDQTFAGLRYTYRLTYYENRPSDSTDQQHTVDLLFSHTFNPRLTLDVRDQLRRGVEPEVVDLESGVPVILRRRGDFLYNNLNGTISYNLSRRWVTSVRGSWQYWDYDVAAVASNDNRNIYDSTLSFLYAVDRLTTAGVNYRYGRIDYDQAGTNDFRNSDSHLGYLTLLRRFTPRFSARLDGGVELREFDNGDSQVAPLVDASATFNYAPRSSVGGGVRYSIQTTEVSTFRSADSLSFFGRLTHSLTPKLSVGGNVVLVLDSLENPTTAGAATNLEEVELRVSLNLRYQFTPWCIGDAAYTFETVDSDIAGEDFDRNRVSVGVRLVY